MVMYHDRPLDIGLIPRIGANKNWWYGGTDTGVSAVAADGNPVGTILSVMGLTAPSGYLICDGAEYSVADYPELSAYISGQFGTANYFGGDGETTFAVPDMRNLFLRGYHGETEEQLSGEVGEKQEGTKHIYLRSGPAEESNVLQVRADDDSTYIEPANMEQLFLENQCWRNYQLLNKGQANNITAYYTARPVNMAVLYCIKYVSGSQSVG